MAQRKLNKEQVDALLQNVTYKEGFSIRVFEEGEKRFLQVCEKTTCNRTKAPYDSFGRKWTWSPFMTNSEIVSTCFMAFMAYEEPEIRERFKYKGESIYDPHYDVEKLLELRRSGESEDVREASPVEPYINDEVELLVEDVPKNVAVGDIGVVIAVYENDICIVQMNKTGFRVRVDSKAMKVTKMVAPR